MTQHLPPNLLILFQARPPIPYLPPIEKPKLSGYSGVGQFINQFEDPANVDYSKFGKSETKEERKERKRAEKFALEQEKISKAMKTWDPQKNPKATGDAYKTLFVGRLNLDTSESKIKREFEEFGPVKKIRVLYDSKTGKPRGYAFIEYEKERDMRAAYKHADGRKIDGRRVLVDVERGRTVKGWRPRRFGGGLGSTRAGGEDLNQKYSGREPPVVAEPSAERERERPDVEMRDHRERERTDRDGNRDRDRERDRERDKERDRERDKEKERDHRDDREREHRDGRSREHREHRDRDKDRERDREHKERRDDRERDHKNDRERDHKDDRERDHKDDRERDHKEVKERDHKDDKERDNNVKEEREDKEHRSRESSNRDRDRERERERERERDGDVEMADSK